MNLRDLLQNCPGPPVVIWGTSGGQPVYAIELTVKFWGEGSLTNPSTGVEALIRVIERWYNFRLKAQGDRNKVRSEYRAPFTTPPVNAPVNAATGWLRWRARQDVPLLRPVVNDQVQYDDVHPSIYCLIYYGGSTCWTARLTWALPVRLVLQGDESGRYRIRVRPDLFHRKKTAATLGVREGRLTRELPEVLPGNRR